MAYIGSTPTSQNFIAGTDYFNGTGSQTAFTLTRAVNSVNDIELVINNVVQQPNSYTVSGTTLTISAAPSSGTSNVYVRYLSTTLQSITVPNNSITYAKLDSNLQADIQGRNRIINGAMTIAQRATSVTSGSGYCCTDRFDFGLNVVNWNVAQSSDVPTGAGFKNSSSVTVTTASSGATSYAYIYHAIEGYNLADIDYGTSKAKTTTLSFWVKSSVTGTYGIALRNTGSGRFYTTTYTINSANTWEQKSITITGDTSGTWNTTNGTGLGIFWDLGVGSTYSSASSNAWTTVGSNYFGVTSTTKLGATNGATFYITGVQLEEGTTATSFERESYSVTLQKCQRYYQAIGAITAIGNFYDTTQAIGVISYPVAMRTTPTLSATGAITLTDTGANYSQSSAVFTSSSVDQYSASVRFNNLTGIVAYRPYFYNYSNSSSRLLTFSAEL